jgi:hypothetical protein
MDYDVGDGKAVAKKGGPKKGGSNKQPKGKWLKKEKSGKLGPDGKWVKKEKWGKSGPDGKWVKKGPNGEWVKVDEAASKKRGAPGKVKKTKQAKKK